MYTENTIYRWLFLFTIIAFMRGIFAIISRRGSTVLGFNLNIKTIILISIGLLVFFVVSMVFKNLPRKTAEIIGSVMLRIIYVIRAISPILILVDIIGIWYKIPVVGIITALIIWIGIGIYQGTQTKITNLNILNTRITEDSRIVFISDLHVNEIHNIGYIQSIVNRIKKIKPDFVLIGGDIVDSAKSRYVSAFQPFNELNIPVFATLGNHDHMGDSETMPKIFETTNIVPLRNKGIEMNGLQIVGIDDKTYRSGKNLTEILQDSAIKDNGLLTILVSHQPQNLKKLEGFPIDLELAGHTHHGQFIPLSWIIGAFNDYVYGAYHLGDKMAFVSQGIGSRGAPIRIGTQSELVIISLTNSSIK